MLNLFDNPRAFRPFFDEAVSIVGVRPNGGRIETSARACVIDNGFDETIGDDGPSSSRRSYSISIEKREWLYESAPQIGDVVKRRDGVALSVTAVEADVSTYNLIVRS